MIATSILMLFLCKKREMNTGSMQLLIEDLMLGISLTGSSLVSLKAICYSLSVAAKPYWEKDFFKMFLNWNFHG